MKKIYSLFLIVLLTVLGTNSALAQFRFGAKGGIDVSNRSLDLNKLTATNELSYQLGLTLEYIIPMSGLGAEVSLLYGRKKYKLEDKQIDATISDYDYISIPLNIKQRVKLSPAFGLFFTGGAYGNVRVNGGSIKSVADEAFKEYKAKNFAFGIGAGAGVNLFNHVDLGISFRGDLTKRYGDEYMDAGIFQNKKNQTWTVGLAYYF